MKEMLMLSMLSHQHHNSDTSSMKTIAYISLKTKRASIHVDHTQEFVVISDHAKDA